MRLADFGQMMRRYRMSHGLTQEDLAAILDIQPKYVSFLENGHRDPSPAVQQRMELLLAKDEWSKNFVQGNQIISSEELTLVLSLYQKLCKIPASNRKFCLSLIDYIMETMTKAI